MFFNMLKKKNDFNWMEEYEEALKQLKEYLTNPPLILKLKDRETLYMYLPIS